MIFLATTGGIAGEDVRDLMVALPSAEASFARSSATNVRTKLSDIVQPMSSSQLTQDPDRVRSGYNTCAEEERHKEQRCFSSAPCSNGI